MNVPANAAVSPLQMNDKANPCAAMTPQAIVAMCLRELLRWHESPDCSGMSYTRFLRKKAEELEAAGPQPAEPSAQPKRDGDHLPKGVWQPISGVGKVSMDIPCVYVTKGIRTLTMTEDSTHFCVLEDLPKQEPALSAEDQEWIEANISAIADGRKILTSTLRHAMMISLKRGKGARP